MEHGPHRPLAGSAPHHHEDAVSRGAVPDEHRIRVTLILRPEGLADDHDLVRLREAIGALLPHERPVLTDEEHERLHRPAEAHVGAVLAFAEAYGLEVIEVSHARHDIVLEGTSSDVGRAFNVQLDHFERGGRVYHGHQGEAQLPEALHEAVSAVLGLHRTPVGRGYATLIDPATLRTPGQVAAHYGAPAGATGAGQRIAILAFGGGFHADDLDRYFKAVLGRTGPVVHPIEVHRGANEPLEADALGRVVTAMLNPSSSAESLVRAAGGPENLGRAVATIEATMDIEVAGAVAPDAEIDVYLTEASAAGFYEGIMAALGLAGAGIPVRYPPAVDGWPGLPTAISISWGDSEAIWPAGELQTMNAALEKARDRHVTVCCASGDLGSLTRPADAKGTPLPANVSFPASSPWGLAIGGTTILDGEPEREGTASEKVWNRSFMGERMASGGGFSGVWSRPEYQAAVTFPELRPGEVWIDPARADSGSFTGRGVPDVAANADAVSGYRIHAGGVYGVGGGTSASAPLWAGLVALVAETIGHPPGWLNGLLYTSGVRSALRSVEVGDNRVADDGVSFFQAADGWDPCTGLGVPDARVLARSLAGRPVGVG